jgi:protein PhnA
MAIGERITERSDGLCELCSNLTAEHEYIVSPGKDTLEYQVALCDTCFNALEENGNADYWRFLEGSIWSEIPSVKALSYRQLYKIKDAGWAADVLNSVDVDDNVIQWAMKAFEIPDIHLDAFGNALEDGDNVVLTQALKVKGANFTASKGTVVKRIKLVKDNTEHIEGKINDQTIVILTKYVKKG